MLVFCYDCAMQYKGRNRGDIIQVYDPDSGIWSEECPNCGGMEFEEDDYAGEEDDDWDRDYL
ncbi:MAG: hypothetical protein AB1Z19_02445 [Eubacteriales bacterium]